MHQLSTVEGFQDAVDNEVVPAEPRVAPGDVVGVDYFRSGTAVRNRSASVVFPLALRPSTATIRGRPTSRPPALRSTETNSDSGATRHGPATGSSSGGVIGMAEA